LPFELVPHLGLEAVNGISERLTRTFVPGAGGRRPCYGGQQKFATEHWRDLILFSEKFDGGNGAGLGATRQTGWTGSVAVFPHLFAGLTGQDLLDHGIAGAFHRSAGQEDQG
jgi:hypothetical protein